MQISDVGPCKKHLKVTIPRSDVEKQFQESVGEMAKEAVVPGFRPGHAPRQLVEKRFRKQVAGQVKSTLLMACLEQIDEDHKLNPISQPELDVEAIELPEDGPMTFEMDVEVRPDFPLPAYKALTIKSPVKTITEADIDAQVKAFRERYAQLVPKLEGGAEVGDFVTADLVFHIGRQDVQRGQGDPVPAPAGAAVPGRDGPGPRQGPGRRQARARSARPTPGSARPRPTRTSGARRSRSPSTSSTSRRSACPSSTPRSSRRPASTTWPTSATP